MKASPFILDRVFEHDDNDGAIASFSNHLDRRNSGIGVHAPAAPLPGRNEKGEFREHQICPSRPYYQTDTYFRHLQDRHAGPKAENYFHAQPDVGLTER